MNKILRTTQVCLLLVAIGQVAEASSIQPQAVARAVFVENTGQICQGDVRYYANIAHGVVHVTGQGEIVYSL